MDCMNNFRKHGNGPFKVAVVHGGPGARGEMYPIAVELSTTTGILEPLQTADWISGQVEELKQVIETQGEPPLTLIGHSWGAWLVCLLAVKHPALVKKIILVSSGPFEEKYAAGLTETRLSRLKPGEREEMERLLERSGKEGLDDAGFSRIGVLAAKADSYRRLPETEIQPGVELDGKIFQRVWAEASELRRSGQLLKVVESLSCEVVAIHGDYDPHPFAGVQEPLSRAVKNFRFILLEKCGHEPWMERYAREEFYGILRKETNTTEN